MSSVDRIASLLALAERTDNEAEAEAFLAKAQHLATLNSIDLAVAQARIAKREARETPVMRRIKIGEHRKHINKHLVLLFSAVAASNDVKIDIASNSTYVIAYGMPSDVDVCEALWGALAHQMVGAANAYINEGLWRFDSYGYTAATARTAFYFAFVGRMRKRLFEMRESAIAERQQVETPVEASATTGTSLVLKAKAEEVASFHRKSSNARGTWGGGSSRVSVSAGAREAGHRAADSARISAAKGIGSRAGALA